VLARTLCSPTASRNCHAGSENGDPLTLKLHIPRREEQ
jgi:hypothetical protein